MIEIVEDIEQLKTALAALDSESTEQQHAAKIILNKMLSYKTAQINEFEYYLNRQFDSV